MTTAVGSLRIWAEVESIVAHELGALLGTTFRPVLAAPQKRMITSVVPLTLASKHLTIQLGIGVDDRTREHLQQALLGGDVSAEAMSDALREMANTAGGALTRSALDEGMSIALGLPSNDDLFSEGTGKRQTWTMADDNGLYVECVVSATRNRQQVVSASQLAEGMVLAADVLDAEGGVIAAAGTALTRSMASVIGFVLGDAPVEISAR